MYYGWTTDFSFAGCWGPTGIADGGARIRPTVPLRVVEKRHESKVHVQLLMAVKQGPAGVVGNEVDLDFLIPAEHRDILHDAGGDFPRDPDQLAAVAMQVDGVNVVAGIAHPQAVAPALVQAKCRLHFVHREGHAVYGPPVEA